MKIVAQTEEIRPKEKNKEVWNTTNPFKAIDKDQFPVSRGSRRVFDKPKLVKRNS